MKLWVIDMKTGECEEVVPEASRTIQYADPDAKALYTQNEVVRIETHHKVTNDPEKFYAWAINKKNAVKRFQKSSHG